MLVAYPAPAVGTQPRAWVNLVLFLVTVFTTLVAGTLQYLESHQPQADMAALLSAVPGNLWHGLPFAAALLGILGVHEFGHYFVARRYKLDVSLPFFVPFPNPYTGTMGAVIRIQSPFESRRALFDVGIAGPLAGLAVAIPVIVVGLSQARVILEDTAFVNTPLLFQWLQRLVVGPLPPGQWVDMAGSPLLMAGWWGLLITALNLVPLSQLDGGHVAYALLGSRFRYLAWLVFGLAAVVTLANLNYVLMLLLVLAMGLDHPPALNDLTPIGTTRTLLGILTLGLFLLLVTVQPFR